MVAKICQSTVWSLLALVVFLGAMGRELPAQDRSPTRELNYDLGSSGPWLGLPEIQRARGPNSWPADAVPEPFHFLPVFPIVPIRPDLNQSLGGANGPSFPMLAGEGDTSHGGKSSDGTLGLAMKDSADRPLGSAVPAPPGPDKAKSAAPRKDSMIFLTPPEPPVAKPDPSKEVPPGVIPNARRPLGW